jgi:tripartite ATP-independent transporter DctM subunit
MNGFEIALSGIGAMLVLLVVRVPVGVAMLAVGMGGYWALAGWPALLNYSKSAVYFRFATYDLSVIPMFLLMSQFAAKAGLSRALFDAANSFLGHRKGGVAMAVIAGCAGFGAICGSSLATAATMAQVALPELRRYKYSGALATGTLAAGGTLGILIPPSIVLVIYAVAVEANIATLFQAAFIPGILAALGYVLAIAVYVRLKPDAGPTGAKASARERFRALVETWPVILIFIVVIGGIYFGVFTPTEAAAVGAFFTGVIAYWRGGLRWKGFLDSMAETAVYTAMIFMILLGADFLNAFLALSRMPADLAEMLSTSGLAPLAVLLVITGSYLILGCLMDSLAMILLTLPIYWPIMAGLDFGMPVEDTKIWFGILTLILVEVGLVTPPIGLNVFIINAMAGDVPMRDTFRGVVPFLISDAIRVTFLIAFPIIILWLPRLLH